MGEQLNAGRVVMCKSGKDRTGMLITHCEAKRIDNEVCSSSNRSIVEILRTYGTRIKNTEKNTGKAQYMFNSLQNTFLPNVLKAPKNTHGPGIT